MVTGKWLRPFGGNCILASLVPVGNRIYHQGGSGCRSHGSCSDGIEPDARLNSVGIVVGSQLFVNYIIFCYLSGTGWQPYLPPGGAGRRTHLSCPVVLSQSHVRTERGPGWRLLRRFGPIFGRLRVKLLCKIICNKLDRPICIILHLLSKMVIPDKVDLVMLPVSLLDQHGSLLYHLQEQAGCFDLVLWGE